MIYLRFGGYNFSGHEGSWYSFKEYSGDDIISLEISAKKMISDSYFTREPQLATVKLWDDDFIGSTITPYISVAAIGKDLISRFVARIYDDSTLLMTGLVTVQDIVKEDSTVSLNIYDALLFLEMYKDAECIVQEMESTGDYPGVVSTLSQHEHMLKAILTAMQYSGILPQTINYDYDPIHTRTWDDYGLYEFGDDYTEVNDACTAWANDKMAEIEAGHVTPSVDYNYEYGFYLSGNIVVFEMRTSAQVYAGGSPAYYRRYLKSISFPGVLGVVKSEITHDEEALGTLPNTINNTAYGDDVTFSADYGSPAMIYITGSGFIRDVALIAGTYNCSDLLKTALLINDLAIFTDNEGNIHIMNKLSGDSPYTDVTITDNEIIDGSMQTELLRTDEFTPDMLVGLNTTDDLKQYIVDYYNEYAFREVLAVKTWGVTGLLVGQYLNYGAVRAKMIEIETDNYKRCKIRAIYGGV